VVGGAGQDCVHVSEQTRALHARPGPARKWLRHLERLRQVGAQPPCALDSLGGNLRGVASELGEQRSHLLGARRMRGSRCW
jgi:hypothetical protein